MADSLAGSRRPVTRQNTKPLRGRERRIAGSAGGGGSPHELAGHNVRLVLLERHLFLRLGSQLLVLAPADVHKHLCRARGQCVRGLFPPFPPTARPDTKRSV